MFQIPGQFKRTLEGNHAFIPNALAPNLALPAYIERQIEEATHYLGQVEMCRTLLPNADLLIYSSLQREALASSTIEGTIASPDELLRFQVSDHAERQDVLEVANYRHALEWGVEQLSKRPVGTVIILGLHERLLNGVRGARYAGRFKNRQNYIGNRRDASIEEAVFVPAPPEEISRLITELETYINKDQLELKVVQCALTHYQFETIHPFDDGNGRVGRLLIILQMIQLGLLSAPLIYPSVYFERHREAYYSYLQAVRNEGAWNDWISFFAEGIKQQCQETIALTKTIIALQKQLQGDVGNVRSRATISAVLNIFFQVPVLPLSTIAREAHIAINSARTAVEWLQERGWVYEATRKQKGRVYVCRPIWEAIFRSVPVNEQILNEPEPEYEDSDEVP